MSANSRFLPLKNVIGGDSGVSGDGSANIISLTTDIRHLIYIGYTISWTGTLSGTLAINVSGDGKTWFGLPGFAVTSPTGGASSTFVDLIQTSALYIQLIYTKSSGAGNISASIFGKGV